MIDRPESRLADDDMSSLTLEEALRLLAIERSKCELCDYYFLVPFIRSTPTS